MQPQNFSIQQLLNDEIKENNKQYPFLHWRASSLGSCLTAQYLLRADLVKTEEYDDRTLRVFDFGKQVENFLIERIKKQLFKKHPNIIINTQENLYNEEYDFTGHPDLHLVGENNEWQLIYEIKSKHSKSFWYMDKKGQGAQFSHQMQLWSYLWMKNIEEGRIIYFSKDDQAILEYPVFLNDEKIKKAVLTELDILNRAWKEKLPPEPIRDKKDWRVQYCRCHESCMNQEKYLENSLTIY